MTMPGMTGAELSEAAHSVVPGLPVVTMSGYSADDGQPGGPGDGSGATFIQKPFTIRELSDALHAVLG